MTLSIIATPIGNLKDITFRAVETLKSVDLIVTEDTRRAGILLKHYEIKKPLLSYHDHNEHYRTTDIIFKLKAGANVALITDAGTPGISDPGYLLIKAARDENIVVEVLPGACAAIVALVGSGLPCDSFTFDGFLPKTQGRKENYFAAIRDEETTLGRKRTHIFYESPHRISKTIAMMHKIIPEHKVAVCRELSKKFEEYICGTATQVYEKTKDKEILGEIVVIVY